MSRGLAYAPYAVWYGAETSTRISELARRFAVLSRGIRAELLAYNCSCILQLAEESGRQDLASFQQRLSDMGCKYQFITAAGITACGSACSRKLAHAHTRRARASTLC
ncbi:hypothetical protein KCP78_21180 [Salmonella enterica subsp. enterica]|nr:hypothetical protein KCP78_21180 [Salmonella enterica subsp. enterica]